MDSVSPNPSAAQAHRRSSILVYLLADPNDRQISEAILKHLKPIVRNFPLPIEIDSDFSAPPGTDREKYEQKLFEANIVLPLISSDFIDNDALYARNQIVMERHNRGQTVMIPVLIRNCMWKRTPFARLDLLPRNYQPLNNKQYWNSQDDAIMAVVEDIDRSLNELAHRGAIQLSLVSDAKSGVAGKDVPQPPAAQAAPSGPASAGRQGGAERPAFAAATIGASSPIGVSAASRTGSAGDVDWRRNYYWGVFWKRGLALFLDYLLAALLTGIILAIGLIAGGGSPRASDNSNSPWTLIIFLALFYLVCPYIESRWWATFGKMVMGLQITDKDGNRISFWRAFWRNLLRSISFYLYCLIVPAVYQYFRFRETRMLFHDEWSHTVIGERLKSAKVTIMAPAPAE